MVGPAGSDGTNGLDGQGGVSLAGTNVSITGTGTVADPYIINATDNVNDNDCTSDDFTNDSGKNIDTTKSSNNKTFNDTTTTNFNNSVNSGKHRERTIEHDNDSTTDRSNCVESKRQRR